MNPNPAVPNPEALPAEPTGTAAAKPKTSEFEAPAIAKSRAEQHAKQEAVLRADSDARLGFKKGDGKVKRPGDPGVAVHIAPSAPPVVRAAPDAPVAAPAADAARARAAEAERLAAEARARGEG